MAEVKFLLKEPKLEEPTLVFLFYRFNKQKLKYSTGIKIHPKYWNPQSQKARLSREFTESESINNTLENLTITLKTAHRDLINSKTIPTSIQVKKRA